MDQRAYRPAMSDLAIITKTGKSWDRWFEILDELGALRLEHKAIVKLLGDKYKVGPWWRLAVTREYERARGRRALGGRGVDRAISVSRTVPASLPMLYGAAADARRRRRWFPKGRATVTALTENKSLRATWNGDQRIEVHVAARASGKVQVVVRISGLEDDVAVERERAAWKKALVKLEAMLSD